MRRQRVSHAPDYRSGRRRAEYSCRIQPHAAPGCQPDIGWIAAGKKRNAGKHLTGATMPTTLQYHNSHGGRRAEAASRRPVHLAMFLFVWLPAALFFTAIISCMSGVFISLLGVIVGPGVALFLVYAIRRNQQVWRERRASAILGYVENAVRLNLPLDKFLAAAEASEDYPTGRSLAHVRM